MNSCPSMEKIIGKRLYHGRLYYLIKWKGYPVESSTWKPVENLSLVKDMIDNYNSKAKIKCNKNEEINKPNQDMKKSMEIEKEISSDINKNMTNNINNIKKEEKENYFNINSNYKCISGMFSENDELFAYVDIEDNKTKKLIKKKISIKDLKNINPWILIEFYESKAKFIQDSE